ncbi:MAG: hypothetical protein R2728_04985 [Chitinophagales bacterium]
MKNTTSFLGILMLSLLLAQCDWNYDVRPFLFTDDIALQDLSIVGGFSSALFTHPVNQYGHVWSMNNDEPIVGQDFVTELNFTPDQTPIDSTRFISKLTNVPSSTDIYYRAYVELDNGDIFYSATKTFNLSKDFWVKLPYEPNCGPGKRRAAISFTYNNVAYVGFGNEDNQVLKDLWKFDPSNPNSCKWVKLQDVPAQERQFAVAFVIGDAAYIGSGNNFNGNLKDFISFDLINDEWLEPNSDWSIPKNNTSATVVSTDSFAILAGGVLEANNNYSKEVWMFRDNNWMRIDDLPSVSGRIGMTSFILDKKAYFGLGEQKAPSEKYPSNFYVLNLETFEWKNEPINLEVDGIMAIGRRYASSFVINDIAYVGIGDNQGSLSDFYKFKDDSWEKIKSYPFETNQAVSFSLNEQGYIFGGEGIESSNNFQTYYP